MIERLKSEKGRGSRGSAMVEFAVILPFLIFLLFGFIQWGLIFGAGLTLRNAAAATARNALVNDYVDADVNTVRTFAFNAIQPLLSDNAALGCAYTGVTNGIKQVDLTYDFPLILRFVVPSATGNVFRVSARAIMQ